MSWSEQFIDAFNTHEVEPMQAICSPDIKWEDVSGHIEFEGHDGVKNMVEVTLMADAGLQVHPPWRHEGRQSLHGRMDHVGHRV